MLSLFGSVIDTRSFFAGIALAGAMQLMFGSVIDTRSYFAGIGLVLSRVLLAQCCCFSFGLWPCGLCVAVVVHDVSADLCSIRKY